MLGLRTSFLDVSFIVIKNDNQLDVLKLHLTYTLGIFNSCNIHIYNMLACIYVSLYDIWEIGLS